LFVYYSVQKFGVRTILKTTTTKKTPLNFIQKGCIKFVKREMTVKTFSMFTVSTKNIILF